MTVGDIVFRLHEWQVTFYILKRFESQREGVMLGHVHTYNDRDKYGGTPWTLYYVFIIVMRPMTMTTLIFWKKTETGYLEYGRRW